MLLRIKKEQPLTALSPFSDHNEVERWLEAPQQIKMTTIEFDPIARSNPLHCFLNCKQRDIPVSNDCLNSRDRSGRHAYDIARLQLDTAACVRNDMSWVWFVRLWMMTERPAHWLIEENRFAGEQKRKLWFLWLFYWWAFYYASIVTMKKDLPREKRLMEPVVRLSEWICFRGGESWVTPWIKLALVAAWSLIIGIGTDVTSW